MRLALISDITPVPLTAGPLVIYRHFQRMEGHKALVISAVIPESDPEDRHWEVLRLPRSLRWLRRSFCLPFFEEIRAWQVWYRTRSVLVAFQPEVILTLWVGEFLLAASLAASRLNVPLVVICHDDLEEMMPRQFHVKAWAKWRLPKIYRQASSRLCVSPRMEEEFRRRYGATGTVLYPMPGDTHPNGMAPSRRNSKSHQGLRIGYAGRLGGELKPLRALAEVLGSTKGELHIASPTNTPSREKLSRHPAVRDQGSMTPDRTRSYFVSSVDAMVVPQSFEAEDSPCMALNFPSKLAECAQFGLPLLVIAPLYASAARWVGEYPEAAVLVSEINSDPLARAVTKLSDASYRDGMARNLQHAATKCFSPEAIHQILEDALQGTTRRQRA